MSLLSRRLRTSKALWALASVVLFVLLGTVGLTPEAKENFTYWTEWGIFLRGNYHCSAEEIWLRLMMVGFILSVPSVVIGWVFQAIAVTGVALLRRESSPARSTGSD